MTRYVSQKSLGNIPSTLSSFIGREQELKQVKQLLMSNHLVTITGAGGAGKTRLAVQIAIEVADDFPDGAWLIELAPISDSSLIPATIAFQLNIHEKAGQPFVETLVNHLMEKNILLVIDNCEHVITACAHVVDSILKRCPYVHILSTSRELLGITGEFAWTIPPLALPTPQPWKSPTAASNALNVYKRSEAVQLFIKRASDLVQEFELSTENGAWVAEICRRLDGMPLAIELAAARTRTLSAEQIARRLDDRFNLLTGGSRTAEPRQQTLAATLDWSYTLLSEAEQNVLKRLSVFSGGCTLEAAQTVCSDSEIVEEEVMNQLSRLVEKSLVVVDRSKEGQIRYQLLETIRQYAGQKLAESGKSDVIRKRHIEYFTEWAELMDSRVTDIDQLHRLELFDQEHDNIRAALKWGKGTANVDLLCLRLASAMGNFWRYRNHISEGRQQFNSVLADRASQVPTIYHARALYGAYTLAFHQSEYSVVRELAEKALSIAEKLGSEGRLEQANAYEILAEVASETGDYETAPPLYEKALSLYRSVNHLVGVGDTLKMLGYSAMRSGNYIKAQSHLEEAIIICRKAGDLRHICATLLGLGDLSIRMQQYAAAEKYLNESLVVGKSLGDNWGLAAVKGALGWLALTRNEHKQARKNFEESLHIRIESGDVGGLAWCFEKLAELGFREGRYYDAVVILGGADALRRSKRSMMDLVDRPNYERIISELNSALDPDAFSSAWAEGQEIPLKKLTEIALALPVDEKQDPSSKTLLGGLTKRELEAAILIAKGRSNRDIAEAMTVGLKTVETYVTRILQKLGFDSRVQIARWVLEKGLDKAG